MSVDDPHQRPERDELTASGGPTGPPGADAWVVRTLEATTAERAVFLFHGEVDAENGFVILHRGPGRDRLIGGTAEGALAIDWAVAMHPNDRSIHAEAESFERLSRGAPVEVEFRLVGVDGVTRWLNERLVPRFEDGRWLVDAVVVDVSAQHAARVEAITARDHLENVLRASSMLAWSAVIGVDNVLRPAYFGPGFRKLLGLDRPSEDIFAAWREQVHPDDRPGWDAMLKDNAAGKSVTAEYRVVRDDGDVRVLRDTTFVSPGVEEGTIAIVGVLEDVTAERATLDALAAAESAANERGSYLAAIVESIPTAVWSYDGDGQEVQISRHWQEMTGQDVDDWFVRGFTAVLHDDDRARVVAAWERMVRDGEPFVETYRIHRADTGAEAVLHERGHAVAGIGFVGMTEDVTERIRHEEALATAKRYADERADEVGELLAQTSTLQAIAEQAQLEAEDRAADLQRERDFTAAVLAASTDYAIISTDREGMIKVFNTGAELLLGCTSAEVVDVTTSASFHLASEVVERAAELGIEPGFGVFVHAIMEGGAETREWTFVRTDGSHVPVSLTETAMFDETGTPIGFLGIAVDISERKARDAALVDAAAEMKRIATTDALTGLVNRRHAAELMRAVLADGEGVGIAMLDVDRFKRVNDTYGHAGGDAVLVEVAQRLRDVRATDLVARWGGEEFCVLLRDVTDDESLLIAAERLRAAIAVTPVVLQDGSPLPVTVSIGISRVEAGNERLEDLVDHADRGLYSAKRRGRNQVRKVCAAADEEAADTDLLRLVEAIGLATSIRERTSALHCRQVASLAADMAVALGFPAATVQRCTMGGWVHDVGKLALPDRILAKRGPLDDEERVLMESHTTIGHALAQRIPGLEETLSVILHHHERFDGGGYPAGLAGEQIPIEARVVAVADAYATMTSERRYRRSLEHDEALAEIDGLAGAQFDPQVVAALHQALDRRLAR